MFSDIRPAKSVEVEKLKLSEKRQVMPNVSPSLAKKARVTEPPRNSNNERERET